MSNSNLVDYKLISKNKTVMNNKVNKKITIHHMAGNLSVESCGKAFQGSRQASSNYGIGSDGRVGLYVDEKDRSWASSNADNDKQAVTIEVANNSFEPYWTVSDKAYNKLIDLCVDICKRNKIDKLVWTGDKRGNLTCHYMFKPTLCPGPYLKSKMSEIARLVNDRLAGNTTVTAKKNIDMDVSEIYKFFKNKGLTNAGVSGLLGNMMAESGIRSNNLQDSYQKKLGLDDITYTVAVNEGAYTKEAFIGDWAGYGLCQWTSMKRKQSLYEYAETVGHTIDSTEMQVNFLYEELKTYYNRVLNILKTSNDIRTCSDTVLKQFEIPADQSETVQKQRYNYSLSIYKKYAGEATNGVDSELKCPFLVKVDIDNLNIRERPTVNSSKQGKMPKGKFTITKVQSGAGSSKGWGYLKSELGWISLDYVTILKEA